MAFLFRNKIGYIYDEKGIKHPVFSKIFHDGKWNYKRNLIGQNIDCNAVADLAIANIAIVNFGQGNTQESSSIVGEAIIGETKVGV